MEQDGQDGQDGRGGHNGQGRQNEQGVQGVQGSQSRQDGDQRAEAFITGCAYGALILAGLVFGLVESFTYAFRIGVIPVAAISLSMINFACIVLAGRGMGSKLGAVVPAAGWWVALTVMSISRPEGDQIVAGTLPGYLYMLGGTVAALAGILVTPSGRSWLLAGSAPRIG